MTQTDIRALADILYAVKTEFPSDQAYMNKARDSLLALADVTSYVGWESHKKQCPALATDGPNAPYPCRCGLDAAVARLEGIKP